MNPVEKIELGKSGVKVTRLGFGGCPLGGLYKDMTEEAAKATVDRALALGINFFNTAPLYGSGKSESRLGKILARHDRSEFVPATKAGFALVPIDPNANEDIFFPFENAPPLRPANDYSYDGAMRCFEQSLQRLGLDRIDVLHIHEPADFYEEAKNGAFKALQKLREQGVIKAVGAAMNQVEIPIRFARDGGFDCFLIALRHTLLEHWAFKELLPLCSEKNISLIIGAPYSSGILASGAKPGAKYCYLDPPADVLEKVENRRRVPRLFGSTEGCGPAVCVLSSRCRFGDPGLWVSLRGRRESRHDEPSHSARVLVRTGTAESGAGGSLGAAVTGLARRRQSEDK